MKLNFPVLDDALVLGDGATIFTVTSTKIWANLIEAVYHYSEEEGPLKLYRDNYKRISSENLMVVSDVLGYNVNSPAVLKLIYADLEQQLNENLEVKGHLEQLTNEIAAIVRNEVMDHELDLEQDTITVIEIFKALGIKIETQSDTILDKLIEIVQVYHYLPTKKLLILINVGCYLTQEEQETFIEYIRLQQCRVLLLEPRRVPHQRQFVLDDDFYLEEEFPL